MHDDSEGKANSTPASWEVRTSLAQRYELFEEVRRVALRVLRRHGYEDAEDLAQDVVMAVLLRVEQDPRYFDSRSVSGWAGKAARYAASAWEAKRDAAESNAAVFVKEYAEAQQASADPQLYVERSELRERLDRAIAMLAPTHRAVLLSVCMDGRSQAETAQRLGLSIHTVKTYLRGARAVVSRELQSTSNHRDHEAQS